MKEDDHTMTKSVKFDGHIFTRSDGERYYRNTKYGYLHRYVWEKHYGDIPEGYEIHHIDRNTDNNDISNLECLSSLEHHKFHARLLTLEQREWRRQNLEENGLPKAEEWHHSDEGRAWHKKHYAQMASYLHRKRGHVCAECGKKFISRDAKSKFCSNACKSKWRREHHIDDETRVCLNCGKKYRCNKYSKRKFCSRKCAARYNADHKLNLSLSKR